MQRILGLNQNYEGKQQIINTNPKLILIIRNTVMPNWNSPTRLPSDDKIPTETMYSAKTLQKLLGKNKFVFLEHKSLGEVLTSLVNVNRTFDKDVVR